MAFDPTKTRMIQTKDGVASIPKTQEGIPFKDYFRNTTLPEDLNRAVIFVTETGPIVAEPDPVPWSEVHNQKVADYAERVMGNIEDRGSYKNLLDNFAKSLTRETGVPLQDTKAAILQKFEENYGHDAYSCVQDYREARGLPTSRSREADRSQTLDQEYEQ